MKPTLKLLFFAILFFANVSGGYSQSVLPPRPKTFKIVPGTAIPQHHTQTRHDTPFGSPCDTVDVLDYNTYNEVMADNLQISYNGSWNGQNIEPFAQEITSFVNLNSYDNYRYNYALQAWDSLAFASYYNQSTYYLPLANSTVTLDSLGMFIGIAGDTAVADGKMAHDSLVFSFYGITNGVVGSTPVNVQVITGYNALNQFFTGPNFGYLKYAQIPVGQQFAAGQGFAVRMDYRNKDTSSHCFLSYSYADSCGNVVIQGLTYASPAYPNPFNGLASYNGVHGSAFSGVIDSVGPNTAQVDLTSSADGYNLSSYGISQNCSYYYVQNWEFLALVSVNSSVSLSIPSSELGICGSSPATLNSVGNGDFAGASYTWSNGSNNASTIITNPGTYSVTATTTMGCTVSASASAYIDANLVIGLTTSTTNAGCNTLGTATVTITSGTPPYTYAWSNGDTTATATGLAAGTYQVTVNGTGCSQTASATVSTSPGTLVITATSLGGSCGGNQSSAYVTIVSGTAPYLYHWSNGASTDTVSGLPNGHYTVTVTGSNGCSATAGVTTFAGVNLTVITSQATCNTNNGLAHAIVAGGTAPYSYLWSNGATTQFISNLGASTYYVTATDFNGCTGSASGVVSSSCNSGVCTPVPLSAPGFYPVADSVQPFVDGVSGTRIADFKNYDTLSISGIPISMDSLTFLSINNLPAGLTWATNKPGNTYGPAEDGCISISGTTTASPGQYLLDITVLAYTSIAPITANINALGLKYFLRVDCNSNSTIIPVDTSQTTTDSIELYGGTNCGSNNGPSVSLGSNQDVCSGTQVFPTPVITGGQAPYTYTWTSNGNSLTCNNCQAPSATITQNSNYTVTVSDANNATASASVSYTIATTGSVQINTNGPATFCTGQSVTLSTSQNYSSYSWSTGSNAASIAVSQQGVYGLTVSNGNGCSLTGSISVTVQSPPANLSIIGNPSITPFQSYPYLVTQVSGITYTWSVTGGAVQSGQGTNSVNIIWGATGPYLVTLVQTNQGGCSDTSYLAVVSSTCSLSVNVISIASQLLCTGDTVTLIAQAATGATYQWLLNGTPVTGQTNDTLRLTSSGVYQVQVTQGSCTVLSNSNNFTFQQSPVAPVIVNTNFSGSCISPSENLSVGSNYSSYIWSSGSTTDTVIASASGVYTVTVTNANGCKAVSQPYNVNLSIVAPFQICVVSVDSASGKNEVVWNVPTRLGVDSFLIYKETNQANVFAEIGSVYVDSFSTFIDYSSIPAQQSNRYTLAVLDTCGNVTLQSTPHQTIHLTINQGLGGVWNLIWNAYEGFTFPSYFIYRGTSTSTLQQIATVSSNNLSYTDLNPPTNVNYYMVEVVNPNGCSPSRSADYGASISNIVASLNTGVNNVVENDEWEVYPNPAHDYLSIRNYNLGNAEGYRIKIINTLGQTVSTQTVNGNETKMDVTNWGAAGVYYLEIQNDKQQNVAIKKIVLQ